MYKVVSGLVLTLITFGCLHSNVRPPEAKSDGARSAPEFDLAALSGGRLKSSDLKGKVVIVDFWATWCLACIEDTPVLNAIYEKYKDQGVQLIGIAVQSGDAAEIAAKAKELKMEYPVILGDENIEKAFGGAGGLIGLPMTYVLAKNWTIQHQHLGFTPFKRPFLEKEIAELIR